MKKSKPFYFIMKINIFLVFCVLVYFMLACMDTQKDKKVKIDVAKNIVAKWNFMESNAGRCDDNKSNSPTSCVFTYEGKRYLRNDSYILDSNGKIDSIYSYHNPLGVNIYSIEDYGRYMMSLDSVELKKMKMIQIVWDEKNKRIIDDNEIKNPTLIEKDKLVLKNKARLVIYEIGG